MDIKIRYNGPYRNVAFIEDNVKIEMLLDNNEAIELAKLFINSAEMLLPAMEFDKESKKLCSILETLENANIKKQTNTP